MINQLHPCKIWAKTVIISMISMVVLTTTIPAASDVPIIPPSGKSSILRQKQLSNHDASLFYNHVADRISREYVDVVDNNTLLEGALNGMLQSLDPHSAYLDANKLKEIQNQTHGEYGGLGLEITMDEGVVKVVSPIEDGPAFKVGLITGDLIVMIDDEPVYGLSIIEASDKLKGEPNTKVRIVVRRGDAAPFEVIITREKIKIHPVKSRVEDNFAYIRITTFINENTAKEVKAAIQKIQKEQGSNLKGILIDIRNNAGGLLDQAVEVCDLFLNSGDIVSIHGRDTSKDFVFKASKQEIVKGMPIVVLINGGTASAPEILAGALQDHKRAIIVGTKSFGKGSVQTVFPISNGGAIKLTTALYYTPSGKSIQKTGIQPDIQINQSASIKDINEDKRQREANLQKALKPGRNLKEGSAIPIDIKDKSDNVQTKEPKDDKKEQTSVITTDTALEKSSNSNDKTEKPDALNDILQDVTDYQLSQAFNILRALTLPTKSM